MQHNEETKLNKRTSVGSASCESAVSSLHEITSRSRKMYGLLTEC